MEFDGERFLPEIKGQVSHEHWHRYAMCRQFAAGRRVLDAASGEGYGSALLATVASEVVGLDIDTESIGHASARYGRPGLSFVHGDCEDLPFPDAAFDVIVSFETIEHVTRPERFLAEVRRVLRPDGTLIISTPNRTVYSERSGQTNPFHVKEFTLEEFVDLLRANFNPPIILGERFYLTSVIGEIHPSEPHRGYGAFSATADGIEDRAAEIRNPKYLIAICADQQTSSVAPSVFFDSENDLWEDTEKTLSWAASVHHELEAVVKRGQGREVEFQRKEELLATERRRYEDELRLRTVQFEEQKARIEVVESELRREMNASSALRRQVASLTSEMESLKASASWRITAPLRSDVLKYPRQTVIRYAKGAVNYLRLLPTILFSKEWRREYRLISASDLFDSAWYMNRYPDVRKSGLDPVTHFLRFGAAKKRDPGPAFKTRWYLRQHAKGLSGGVNPLVFHLKNGVPKRWPTQPGAVGRGQGEKLFAYLRGRWGVAAIGEVRRLMNLISRYEDDPTLFETSEDLPLLLDEVTDKARHVASEPCDVSIIVPVHNALVYTLTCLASLLGKPSRYRFEVLVGDDASGQVGREALASIGGAVRHVFHETNLGFLRNCNETATRARGRHLVFLNNDTILLPGWLDELIRTLDEDNRVGLVGSKLLNADGTLQEAGGILWRDGSGWNFGRRGDPRKPQFNYLKDVDYCSGASIAIRKALWEKLGGFDEAFSPAYCEDSDLAFRVRAAGYRTLYQPFSELIHHEGRSHGRDLSSGVKAYQVENQAKLAKRWAAVLAADHFEPGQNLFVARDHSHRRGHVLFVDHHVPRWDSDAGSRTIFDFMRVFLDRGFRVSFWPDNLWRDPQYTEQLQRLGVEVIYKVDKPERLSPWLRRAEPWLSYVLLSRPQVAKKHIEAIRKNTAAKILYYGHDLHWLRMEREYQALKKKKLLPEIKEMQALEERVWSRSHAVLYPSEDEVAVVRAKSKTPAVAIPMAAFDPVELAKSRGGSHAVADRDPHALMFIGGFLHGPNVDGMLWFVEEVLPRLYRIDPAYRVTIAGSNPPEKIQALAGHRIAVLGRISDQALEDLYRRSGVSVVPLRFGAGVKGKVIEAFAHGIPVVSTSVGMQGIENPERLAFVADDPADFAARIVSATTDHFEARTRTANALDFIAKNYSLDAIAAKLSQVVPELDT